MKLLVFTCTAWAVALTIVSSADIEATGFFVIPDGKSTIKANTDALICLNIQNTGKEPITLAAIRQKGVEQLKENPMPVRQDKVVPCYLDGFHVEFYDANGKLHCQRDVLSPFSGQISPDSGIALLIQVLLPDKAGRYTVKIAGASDGKSGSFAFAGPNPELRFISCKDIPDVKIEGVIVE